MSLIILHIICDFQCLHQQPRVPLAASSTPMKPTHSDTQQDCVRIPVLSVSLYCECIHNCMHLVCALISSISNIIYDAHTTHTHTVAFIIHTTHSLWRILYTHHTHHCRLYYTHTIHSLASMLITFIQHDIHSDSLLTRSSFSIYCRESDLLHRQCSACYEAAVSSRAAATEAFCGATQGRPVPTTWE